MFQFTRRLAVAALISAALPLSFAAAQETTLTVFAAASMKNALDDANAAFTKATGVKVTASYAASSALAKQMESGAPADVFISADLNWMDYVAGKNLIKADSFSGRHPSVSRYNPVGVIDQHGVGKAKATDRAGDLANLLLRMGPGIG